MASRNATAHADQRYNGISASFLAASAGLQPRPIPRAPRLDRVHPKNGDFRRRCSPPDPGPVRRRNRARAVRAHRDCGEDRPRSAAPPRSASGRAPRRHCSRRRRLVANANVTADSSAHVVSVSVRLHSSGGRAQPQPNAQCERHEPRRSEHAAYDRPEALARNGARRRCRSHSFDRRRRRRLRAGRKAQRARRAAARSPSAAQRRSTTATRWRAASPRRGFARSRQGSRRAAT